jgi:shikimate dehydrogenase
LAYNKWSISGASNVYGVIGDPIDHSLSPAIQNTAFRVSRIDAIYVPFSVRKHYLKQAINGLRALGVKGFNVTAPHKIDVIQHLDKLEPSAEEIGSVNTVLSRNGILCGHNTDGLGALKTLEEAEAPLNGRCLLLIGAGGAAQAIAHSLASRVGAIRIVNRTLARAKQLEHRLLKKYEIDIETGSDSDLALRQDWFHPNQFVLDIVYKPVETRLLKVARTAGATTIGGLNMLVHQGACSFELWTSRKAPIDAMRNAIQLESLA